MFVLFVFVCLCVFVFVCLCVCSFVFFCVFLLFCLFVCLFVGLCLLLQRVEERPERRSVEIQSRLGERGGKKSSLCHYPARSSANTKIGHKKTR